MSNLIETWASEDSKNLLKVCVPQYLEETYWWAYLHPNALNFFERQWVINLILWGNFARLRDAALDELGKEIHGSILQVACVYGDFSVKLSERLTKNSSLDIVDVVPAQLENLKRKLPHDAPIRFIQNNAAHMNIEDATYDQAVMFFLLHEMPEDVRERTLSESLRVLKPGGKLVIVDFHKPFAWNPLRYLYPIMFKALEPFALDIWKSKIGSWLPKDFVPVDVFKETMFGGMYQILVIHT